MTIDKFNLNPILVNINNYRFVEDHTLQLVLTKPKKLLLEEPMEITHCDNMSIKEPIKVTCFDNLLNEEPIQINHYSDLLLEEKH
jgi:hypothetical protein